MKPVVQLCHLLQMILAGMKLCKVGIFLQLLHLFLRNMLCCPSCTQAFQPCPHHIDILHILHGDTNYIGTLVGDDLNQALQFQLTKGLAHRSSAYTQFLTDRHFLQFFMFFVFSVENIFSYLGIYSSPQRILIRYFLFHIKTHDSFSPHFCAFSQRITSLCQTCADTNLAN